MAAVVWSRGGSSCPASLLCDILFVNRCEGPALKLEPPAWPGAGEPGAWGSCCASPSIPAFPQPPSPLLLLPLILPPSPFVFCASLSLSFSTLLLDPPPSPSPFSALSQGWPTRSAHPPSCSYHSSSALHPLISLGVHPLLSGHSLDSGPRHCSHSFCTGLCCVSFRFQYETTFLGCQH